MKIRVVESKTYVLDTREGDNLALVAHLPMYKVAVTGYAAGDSPVVAVRDLVQQLQAIRVR